MGAIRVAARDAEPAIAWHLRPLRARMPASLSRKALKKRGAPDGVWKDERWERGSDEERIALLRDHWRSAPDPVREWVLAEGRGWLTDDEWQALSSARIRILLEGVAKRAPKLKRREDG